MFSDQVNCLRVICNHGCPPFIYIFLGGDWGGGTVLWIQFFMGWYPQTIRYNYGWKYLKLVLVVTQGVYFIVDIWITDVISLLGFRGIY